MPLVLDHQMREQVGHDADSFPISYFEDDFATLPNRVVPLHWHPELEIMSAERAPLDCQVGQSHILLEAGDSLLVNGNTLHGIRQVSGDAPDRMPNIVFLHALIAPEGSAVSRKYIHPVADCASLPCVVFRRGGGWQGEVNRLLAEVYRAMAAREECHEMAVQRGLSEVFELLYRHLDELPRLGDSRLHMASQVRIQRMQAYIRAHYAEAVTLDDIAGAANISRSEANRCFNAYMGCSPVDALIQYRLETARRLLNETDLTVQRIGQACGFNSESYFNRRYRRVYGCTPGSMRGLGK